MKIDTTKENIYDAIGLKRPEDLAEVSEILSRATTEQHAALMLWNVLSEDEFNGVALAVELLTDVHFSSKIELIDYILTATGADNIVMTVASFAVQKIAEEKGIEIDGEKGIEQVLGVVIDEVNEKIEECRSGK